MIKWYDTKEMHQLVDKRIGVYEVLTRAAHGEGWVWASPLDWIQVTGRGPAFLTRTHQSYIPPSFTSYFQHFQQVSLPHGDLPSVNLIVISQSHIFSLEGQDLKEKYYNYFILW